MTRAEWTEANRALRVVGRDVTDATADAMISGTTLRWINVNGSSHALTADEIAALFPDLEPRRDPLDDLGFIPG